MKQKPRSAEVALVTLADNVESSVERIILALRSELMRGDTANEERMNHYDNMLQALTELVMLHDAAQREAVVGLNIELALLRADVEKLKDER